MSNELVGRGRGRRSAAGSKSDPAARSFDAFFHQVRESVECHAQRKNYTTEGADGDNQLLKVCALLGIHEAHAVGEIIYKVTELLKAPRETKKVLLEKIAGWAFVMWREL